MNILITGATGLIGKKVGTLLAQKGHKLYVVSRNATKAARELPFPCEVIEGDLTCQILKDRRLGKIEAVINLMGEPVIGSRWNDKVKKRIYDSRVLGTRNLIASLPETLKVFVSGSAIGFYGDRKDSICHEDDPAGKDFLAEVCRDWEQAATKSPGRVAVVRTGIVLSPEGGALSQMMFPFKAGVGGAVASGQQWMSWISIEDIAGLFIFALENENVRGAVNGTAPHPVTNLDFSRTLARALNRPLGPKIPAVAIKLLFGGAAETLLSSCRGSALHSQSLGYKFIHADLNSYLSLIFAPFRAGEEIFYAEQYVDAPLEKVFEFFKEPTNLEKITPSTLGFKIRKVSTPTIVQGTLIDYTLRIHGVPVHWKTEIDEWQPPHKFVDNQLKGPYRLWHHTHEFQKLGSGTLMTDRVRYRVPLGFLGWLVAGALVRKEVEGIFAFRRQSIETNKWE